jgi:hypothetical protein
MKYRLEWNLGYFESSNWADITSHSQFHNGTAFEVTPFGLCAI